MAESAPGRFFGTWWFHAWGFDWVYDKLFVKPFLVIAHLLRRDPVDRSLNLVPFTARGGHNILSLTENGRLRWYAASLVGGAALLLGALLLT
ncbi:NADH-quinone oxidoreductase subunit L [compost metagenome]